ncbi:retrovirus-related Pol polyprotein from type-1 retrotransposable element R2 [Trichonephila inaurata madagascariensis]|uniref:Retrovirus-related Pol polyprotein from type-1 retrotransposable element R2 n=1 Tax=Trichonephila inaurata madagascariensis TaxID=2747483 RepID=A0A8X6M8G6_9ARAC|nr:retrovirus-related Pol polyprotein from type-1 retrotransposable element R2 [Trichonephila inaurata madagascariensis]
MPSQRYSPLFNLVINETIQCVQGNPKDDKAVSWPLRNDIVLLANSVNNGCRRTPHGAFLQRVALNLNPSKCATLHLARHRWGQGYPLSSSRAYQSKADGDWYAKYLESRDADLYLVDTAFKLLSSKDEEVVVKALADLTRTVRQRIRRDPTNADLAAFLSGSMEGEFKQSTNTLRNTRTLARSGSRRQSITWTFVEDEPYVWFDGNTISIAGRRKLLKTLHQAKRLHHTEALINQRSQGKAIECAAAHPESTHFLFNGKYTRFADWRFNHKARLNLLPLNGAKQWINAASRKCRRCGYENETLPHVLNHCGVSSAGWQRRHNAILERIQKAVAFRGKILSVNKKVGDSRLRPDIVAVIDGKLFIIDVTIPFDNRLVSFDEARNAEIYKYKTLVPFFQEQGYKEICIAPIVVGSLGAWMPTISPPPRLCPTLLEAPTKAMPLPPSPGFLFRVFPDPGSCSWFPDPVSRFLPPVPGFLAAGSCLLHNSATLLGLRPLCSKACTPAWITCSSRDWYVYPPGIFSLCKGVYTHLDCVLQPCDPTLGMI